MRVFTALNTAVDPVDELHDEAPQDAQRGSAGFVKVSDCHRTECHGTSRGC